MIVPMTQSLISSGYFDALFHCQSFSAMAMAKYFSPNLLFYPLFVLASRPATQEDVLSLLSSSFYLYYLVVSIVSVSIYRAAV